MDNSSKAFWCCLLFCICCYQPYMLRPNLMNYFASVRHNCNGLMVIMHETAPKRSPSPENAPKGYPPGRFLKF